MAEQAECSENSNTNLENLERRLGQLTYKIAKLQEQLRESQQEANEVATEIEKSDGK